MAKKKVSRSALPAGYRLEHGYVLVKAKRKTAAPKRKKDPLERLAAARKKKK